MVSWRDKHREGMLRERERRRRCKRMQRRTEGEEKETLQSPPPPQSSGKGEIGGHGGSVFTNSGQSLPSCVITIKHPATQTHRGTRAHTTHTQRHARAHTHTQRHARAHTDTQRHARAHTDTQRQTHKGWGKKQPRINTAETRGQRRTGGGRGGRRGDESELLGYRQAETVNTLTCR